MRAWPLVLLWSITCGCARSSADAESAGVLQARAWLPPDSVTIVAVTEPFKTFTDDRGTKLKADDISRALLLPGIPAKMLGWKIQAQWGLKGLRNIRPPRDLGLFHFDGCVILGIEGKESSRLRPLLEKAAAQQTQLEGLKVYELTSDGAGEQDWRWSVVLDGNTLLIATSATYLRELLERRHEGATGGALADTLPHWRNLKRDASTWAVHVSPKAYRGWATMASIDDPEYEGCALWYERDKQELHIDYISKSKDALAHARKTWILYERGLDVKPIKTIDSAGPQAIRIVVDLSVPDAEHFLLALFFAIGHYVII